VTGRNRTCDAPRFRRALYLLSYGHAKWAEPGSNRRPPPHQRGALPPELSACEWARLGSNPATPQVTVRQALYASELLAHELRDKGSNLDLHVQSVASCPLDDPGTCCPPSISPREIDAAAALRAGHLLCPTRSLPSDVVHATRLPFDPGSRPAGCAQPGQTRPTWRSFGARSSYARAEIRKLKHTLITSAYFQHRALRVFLSQAGPRFDLELVQAEHHLWFQR
jgi:hypothetical protein